MNEPLCARCGERAADSGGQMCTTCFRQLGRELDGEPKDTT